MSGSLGRREATGRSVFTVGLEAVIHTGLKIDGARQAVKGFGNVGGTAATLFCEVGAKLVAVKTTPVPSSMKAA